MERIDKEKISENDLKAIMEQNLRLLNAKLPAYSKVSEIKIMPEEFQKTPKKSIKRFLYE
jgi:long-chain acyl-CoA synthetase